MPGFLQNAMSGMGFGNPDKISGDNGLPNGRQDDNNQNQQRGNDSHSQTQFEEEPEFDSTFNEIFGKEDGGEEFELPGDLIKPPKLDAQGNPIPDEQLPEDTTALKDQMKEMFQGFGMKLEEVPDNLDWNDKGQVHKFIKSVQQQSIQQAVALMSLPVQHAIKATEAKMQEMIDSKMLTGNIQNKVQQAYEPIRATFANDRDRGRANFASTTFQSALKQLKDPAKAAASTIKMLESMFPEVKIQRSLRRQSSSSSNQFDMGEPSFKSGDAALNDLFNMK